MTSELIRTCACAHFPLFLFFAEFYRRRISPGPPRAFRAVRNESHSHLHFGEFARIYEMLELEVTYSRSRIASTSREEGIKKKRNRDRERGKKKTSINDPFFCGVAAFTRRWLLLISTIRIIQPGKFLPSFLISLSLCFSESLVPFLSYLRGHGGFATRGTHVS